MSVRKNLAYSTVLTLSTYLIPLVVFPYISRILGPEGIGAVDTVEYTINYCILCSMMGLSIIGIREIAQVKNDKKQLAKVFTNLFLMNFIVSFIVVSVLLILIFIIPDFYQRKNLFFIGMLKIVANVFWIEWFYKGIEDFKYITVRSLIVRFLFIVSVFVLVNNSDDNILYYFLFVSITLLNALCNWFYKKKYIFSMSFKTINVRSIMYPYFMLGLFALLSAVYTNLNVAFLGFICNEEEVGYYTTATRLYTVVIALMSTLTGVMIPRMSILVKESKYEEIRLIISKVFDILFMFSIPVIIYILFYAENLIMIFAGLEFLPAAIPMRIVILLLIVIGTEQIYIMQLLVPLKKDGFVTICALCGAFVCILFNFFFVADLKSIGSAFAWLISELTVLSLASVAVKKYFSISFPFAVLLKHILLSMPYWIIAAFSVFVIDKPYMQLLFSFVFFVLYFVVMEEEILKLKVIANLFRKLNNKYN